jgi:lysosomal acid lipase/cholesteryl ester hydrolase
MRSPTVVFVVFIALAAVCVVEAHNFYDICDQVSGALGYPCEHHTVVTADGWELDVVRIPPKNGTKNAYPVILQHGLLDSAITWVMNYYPAQNLGCILHDQGYDVWMPNSRGNHYSMGNTKLSWLTDWFWESIDMDGMAKHDVPANIDYVLQHTNRTKLAYVGHSQGGMQGFAAFSTVNKAYAAKVDLFVGLAPACYVGHATATLMHVLADLDIANIISFLGEKEFLMNDWLIRQIAKFCKDIGRDCSDILDLEFGDGTKHDINQTQLGVVTRYDPGGTSIYNMIHWAQEVKGNNFGMHDWGLAGNLLKYGRTTPPQYHLDQMEGPPTAIFYGLEDALADPEDVARIFKEVQPGIIVGQHALPTYEHMDFVWGMNAQRDVYPKVLSYIQQYQS